jgi:hypothetical protein
VGGSGRERLVGQAGRRGGGGCVDIDGITNRPVRRHAGRTYLTSVIPFVDVVAVSAGIVGAGIEWDQLPVPCAPDIHEQVGRSSGTGDSSPFVCNLSCMWSTWGGFGLPNISVM